MMNARGKEGRGEMERERVKVMGRQGCKLRFLSLLARRGEDDVNCRGDEKGGGVCIRMEEKKKESISVRVMWLA